MKKYKRFNPFTNTMEDLSRDECLALYDRVENCGDEEIGKTYWEFIHREFREEMQQEVKDALAGIFSDENKQRM